MGRGGPKYLYRLGAAIPRSHIGYDELTSKKKISYDKECKSAIFLGVVPDLLLPSASTKDVLPYSSGSFFN